MHRLLIYTLMLSALVLGCVTTQSLQKGFEVGDIHENEINIGRKSIPLPKGEWKVIACGVNNRDFFSLFLIQEGRGNKFNYITISTDSPRKIAKYGYVRGKELDRQNMLFVETSSNGARRKINGWCINHSLVYFNPNDKFPVRKEAYQYIKDNGYVLPNEMVYVGHYLRGFIVKKRYLDVRYYYNPELHGFLSSSNTNWSTSDWHTMRINEFPDKLEFVQNLKEFHGYLHQKIQQGFE